MKIDLCYEKSAIQIDSFGVNVECSKPYTLYAQCFNCKLVAKRELKAPELLTTVPSSSSKYRNVVVVVVFISQYPSPSSSSALRSTVSLTLRTSLEVIAYG